MFAGAQVVLAREITKKFEEFLRGSPAELLAIVRTRSLKGEFVVVVDRESSLAQNISTKTPDSEMAGEP